MSESQEIRREEFSLTIIRWSEGEREAYQAWIRRDYPGGAWGPLAATLRDPFRRCSFKSASPTTDISGRVCLFIPLPLQCG